MIRTAYPVSPLRQVQLRLELAARRTRRALQARRHDLAASASAAMTAPAAVDAAAADVFPAGWEREKAVLLPFYDKFDDLTGLVCLAAQEGVTPVREAKYQAARQWFINACPSGIGEWAGPYLEAEGAQSDAFSHFWTSPTLDALLQSDGGDLIIRMEQTQNALAAWEKSVQARAKAAASRIGRNSAELSSPPAPQ